MAEPASASARLLHGNDTLVEMKMGDGRIQLQHLQKQLNQFLTELIVQQSTDEKGNDQGKDDALDDSSDESETANENPDIKKMKMS